MSTPINIDSRGYGKIYKAVMRNRELPLLAKTIYAYLCTYAGNGIKAFPRRDKITRDLRINKDTYTKHMNRLVTDGYIAKERTASGNIYTIMQTIPAYESPAKVCDDEMTDMLLFENVKAKGFGTIPKLVMLDTRLTAQAKAIYAYFASFAGAGTTAFPRRNTITRELKLSSNSYYAHFNLLVEHGYLSVEQRKNNGKFDICVYHLTDSVEAAPGCVNNAQKPTSDKLRHGESGGSMRNSDTSGESDAVMSEKQRHGAKRLKTSPDMSEKPMSEKMISDETVSEKFGQANNNNTSTRNSYFMKEQEYNHQDPPPRPRQDDDKPVSLFSLQEVKQKMKYANLQREAEGWGNLKEMLGHFSSPDEKERYLSVVGQILDELALQLKATLDKVEKPEAVIAALESEAFTRMFDDILERWDEIRTVKGYVGASLKNLLNR